MRERGREREEGEGDRKVLKCKISEWYSCTWSMIINITSSTPSHLHTRIHDGTRNISHTHIYMRKRGGGG